jgi:AcrR family transcriptional regulator
MVRDDILLAAAQIFRQKGYHAASMNEIAQTVNLQKGSLYYHVSSKQEILLDLLDLGIDLLVERLEVVRSRPLPPPDKLIRACEVYIEVLAEHADLAAVLLFEHRSLTPALQEAHFPRRDAFEQIWQDILQEGVDKGDFICSDVDLTAKFLLGVLNWTLTWYRPNGPLGPGEIGQRIGEMLLSGILKRG